MLKVPFGVWSPTTKPKYTAGFSRVQDGFSFFIEPQADSPTQFAIATVTVVLADPQPQYPEDVVATMGLALIAHRTGVQ